MEKLRSVQVLRGVAACAVVVLHAYSVSHPVSDSPFRLGAAGVDLFFVISGFIIATIPKKAVADFLFDRAWRIYPLWLVAVVPFIILEARDWPTFFASVTLWPAWDRYIIPVLGRGWTLSFEMLFYFAAALAIRTRPIVPLALFTLGLALGAVSSSPLLNLVGNPIIFEFLLGVGIAKLPRAERLGFPLLAFGLALFALSPLAIYQEVTAINADTSILRAVFWGVPAALVLYSCLCLERYFAASIFAIPLLLGDASYSIYLFHYLGTAIPLHWTLQLALGVGAGVIVWRAVEMPIRRNREKARALGYRAVNYWRPAVVNG